MGGFKVKMYVRRLPKPPSQLTDRPSVWGDAGVLFTQLRSRFVAWGCYVASGSGEVVQVSLASAMGQKERQKVVTCAGWFEQGGGRGIQSAPPDLSRLTS